MIIEMRTYTLAPGGVKAYLDKYNESGRARQTEILGNLLGLYQPQSGDLNQIIFLWGYKDMNEREQRRAQLMKDPVFTGFRQATRALLLKQENRFLSVA
ncbi:MAG: NIPSNAP family protein [Alcaligenaceae bacterium]|nr:NIPSNAP family protein [Alcaligenaceae bacterium]